MIIIRKSQLGNDIEYTKGDTFEVNVSTEDVLPDGTTLRFQVSNIGDTNNVCIDNVYSMTDNIFNITLDSEDLNKLFIGDDYQYRMSIVDIDGTVTTTESGNLIIKWGA